MWHRIGADKGFKFSLCPFFQFLDTSISSNHCPNEHLHELVYGRATTIGCITFGVADGGNEYESGVSLELRLTHLPEAEELPIVAQSLTRIGMPLFPCTHVGVGIIRGFCSGKSISINLYTQLIVGSASILLSSNRSNAH